MANTKEIKTRIESVKDTRKITNAMYLIASTKLRKARNDLDRTRPYFEALRTEIKRIFRTQNDVDSRYFYPPGGAARWRRAPPPRLNSEAESARGRAQQQANHLNELHLLSDTKLYVVGEYGRHFFTQHNIPMEHSFLYTAQNPTMQRAREICDILLEGYDRGDFKKIFVIYTDMENSLTSSAHCTRLLPFHRAYFQTDTVEKAVTTPFEFVPSVQAVLNNIMQSYVSGFIYSALIDSFCSEQNARMTAMDSANSNAEKLLAELSLQYNRVRQAAITQEITEVSAGAKAQRQKHRKEA